MASRIKGLTVEINGDVTKLDKALSSADKQLKDLDRSLKDVDRLLKLDPTNTELLAQKTAVVAEVGRHDKRTSGNAQICR